MPEKYSPFGVVLAAATRIRAQRWHLWSSAWLLLLLLVLDSEDHDTQLRELADGVSAFRSVARSVGLQSPAITGAVGCTP